MASPRCRSTCAGQTLFLSYKRKLWRLRRDKPTELNIKLWHEDKMINRRIVFLTIMLGFAVGLTAADDPLMGTWKLNVSKSKLAPTRQRNIMRKHEPIQGGMKVTFTGSDANNKATEWSFSAKFDGKEYPVTGQAPFDVISLKRLDPYTVEGTSKKDGHLALAFRWQVSKDGQTLTRTDKRTYPPKQAGTSTETYEKQ